MGFGTVTWGMIFQNWSAVIGGFGNFAKIRLRLLRLFHLFRLL